jgi:hypothetical protein
MVSIKEWPPKFHICTNGDHTGPIPCCHKCMICGEQIKRYYSGFHEQICHDKNDKEKNE